MIEKYNAGIYFSPENEEDFLNKNQKLYRCKFLQSMPNWLQQPFKDYNRKELAKKMLKQIYKTVCMRIILNLKILH